MTKRSRYTLIGVGVLAFLIVAPALVWYVQGKPLRPGSAKPENTGIISIETEPSGAEVWVNGEKRTSTPGAIRFLETGRYAVELRKEGYRGWQKTISVIGGRVSHANPNPAALKLVKDTLPEVLATNVTALAVRGNQIAYSTSAAVLIVTEEKDNTRTVTLPAPANRVLYIPHADRYVVMGQGYVWIVDPSSLTHTAVAVTFTNAEFQGVGPTLFIRTQKQELLQITLANPTQTTVIATQVQSFATHDTELYYLHTNEAGTLSLHHSTVENGTLVQTQALPTDLPNSPAALFIDEQKAVYILQGQNLYRFGEHASEIARSVTNASVQTGALAYITPGELWWYDSRSLRSNLVSRTSAPIHTYLVSPASQFGIYTDSDGLTAAELNTDAGQNRYTLDSTSAESTVIMFRNTKQILYITNNTLKQLELF
ncbi:MAG: PEGA domain-containing protein [Candidatus Doudnabacteria bacterium]|nr:PEGA domain-containing protein [Candidatus Doudnabacteria bacterium]